MELSVKNNMSKNREDEKRICHYVTQLFMELLKNNGPLWRNQTISLCMDYLKNARIFMGKHGDVRLILMLLSITDITLW